VGGEPGVGKSTLLLQAAMRWGASGVRTLYVSSEESAQQVAARAHRIASGASSSLFLLHDTNLARILEQTRKSQPRVLIIDSVQMIFRGDVPASPGSVTQLRRCAADLVFLAKNAGIAVVLVGHVTKDGRLAGPRLLEHLVDTVLSFEGDRSHAHRVVRAIKNRFGTTQEMGLFAMEEHGLVEVPDGGSLAGVSTQCVPGSIVCPIQTGARCLLVEVQALTATGFLGAAKRKSSGIDPNRLAMIIAVLEQHAGVRLADRDVFVSSVGGLRVADPAADLALLLAIAGAHTRSALPEGWAALGEVGLSGDVRPVPAMQQRIKEAQRLGWGTILAPCPVGVEKVPEGVIPIRRVEDALQHLRDRTPERAAIEPKHRPGEAQERGPTANVATRARF
jgi:DNA repair protein RadA/Sms